MAEASPIVLRLVLGSLQTNCYVVICPETRSALVIDPADDAADILAAVKGEAARVEQILLTHYHRDHVAGLPELKAATGARVLAHGEDAQMVRDSAMFYGLDPKHNSGLLPDHELKDGDEVSIGNLSSTVIHTPGHTPGGITLSVGGLLFTGDTLFNQGMGRVDLPGGNWDRMLASLGRLLALPEERVVYPGHGPSSTIGRERKTNPHYR